jgi:hypothetical protein
MSRYTSATLSGLLSFGSSSLEAVPAFAVVSVFVVVSVVAPLFVSVLPD